MPTIPVNSDGAVLYYEDSGPPNGTEDYTTIIVFHGFIFHGGTGPIPRRRRVHHADN